MKDVVCFSGGIGSALVLIEVFRARGNANLIALNHDIHASVEHADVKRFKQEVADHCGIPITYANMDGWDIKDQFDVVVEASAFKVGTGTALCTHRMKTAPFDAWLAENYPDGKGLTIHYGFEAKERARIQRRSSILGARGYKTDFPLATWERTIKCTSEIGIKPPSTYEVFKHGNCTGCLKAGAQHWYVVYCTRPDIWERALWAEEEIGYTIIRNKPLVELGIKFEEMKRLGIPATEHMTSRSFWILAKKVLAEDVDSEMNLLSLPVLSCECST